LISQKENWDLKNGALVPKNGALEMKMRFGALKLGILSSDDALVPKARALHAKNGSLSPPNEAFGMKQDWLSPLNEEFGR